MYEIKVEFKLGIIAILNTNIENELFFDVQNKTILKNETVKPEELVKNIQDDSDTKVYFVEEYIF